MDDKELLFYDLKKLKRFLLDREAYSSFLKNTYVQNKIKTYKDFIERMDKKARICGFINIICNTFAWVDTKECEEFWNELNDDFIDCYYD